MSAEKKDKTGVFATNFRKHTVRAKEKLLETLGKADRTTDEIFEQQCENFNRQQQQTESLQKHLQRYIQTFKAYSAASKDLTDVIRGLYESEWPGSEHVYAATQSLDVSGDELATKLTEDALGPINNHAARFPEVRAKIAKRGRKLVDFDSARHNLEALQANGKKRDDLKIAKASEQLSESQKLYEDLNSELLTEVPQLYDQRLNFYAENLQLVFDLEKQHRDETAKLCNELSQRFSALGNEAEQFKTAHKVPTTPIKARPSPPPISSLPKVTPPSTKLSSGSGDSLPDKNGANNKMVNGDGGGLYPKVPQLSTPPAVTEANNKPADSQTPASDTSKEKSPSEKSSVEPQKSVDSAKIEKVEKMDKNSEKFDKDSEEDAGSTNPFDSDGDGTLPRSPEDKSPPQPKTAESDAEKPPQSEEQTLEPVVNGDLKPSAVAGKSEEQKSDETSVLSKDSEKTEPEKPEPEKGNKDSGPENEKESSGDPKKSSEDQKIRSENGPELPKTEVEENRKSAPSKSEEEKVAETKAKPERPPEPKKTLSLDKNGPAEGGTAPQPLKREAPKRPPDPTRKPAEASGKVQYRVKTTHAYVREDEDELSFEAGEIIDVLPFTGPPEDLDEGWQFGLRENGDKGVFPENFTKRL